MAPSSSIIVLFALLCCYKMAHTLPLDSNLKTNNRQSSSSIADLRRRVEEAGGCNANVCFAIDGSGSISSTEFTNQKNFVLDLVSVVAVDNAAEVAACQYATAVSPISPLTVDTAKFNLAVNRATQLGGQSFVVGGINYCFSQLWRRRGEANKIVYMGDARSNIGSDAVDRADLFRMIGGSVAAVGAGFTDDSELLRIAGGNSSLVYEADSFLDVLTLQGFIESLVSQICGV